MTKKNIRFFPDKYKLKPLFKKLSVSKFFKIVILERGGFLYIKQSLKAKNSVQLIYKKDFIVC